MANTAKNSVSNSQSVANKKVLLALARQNKPFRCKSLSTQLPLFSPSSLLQSVASSVGMSISKVFALKTMQVVAVRQLNRLFVICSSLNIVTVQ